MAFLAALTFKSLIIGRENITIRLFIAFYIFLLLISAKK
jgi:hypothetical protein